MSSGAPHAVAKQFLSHRATAEAAARRGAIDACNDAGVNAKARPLHVAATKKEKGRNKTGIHVAGAAAPSKSGAAGGKIEKKLQQRDAPEGTNENEKLAEFLSEILRSQYEYDHYNEEEEDLFDSEDEMSKPAKTRIKVASISEQAVEKFGPYLEKYKTSSYDSESPAKLRKHEHKATLEVNPAAQESPKITQGSCGLVFDERCLKHEHPKAPHPERPARIMVIMKTLELAGFAQNMMRIQARKVTQEEVSLAHGHGHFEEVRALRDASVRDRMQYKLQTESVYINESTTEAAMVSAGGVLELVKAVCAGRIRTGLAVVRPPGHHAESCCAKGFCLINNVAVAAAWVTRRNGKTKSKGGGKSSSDQRQHSSATASLKRPLQASFSPVPRRAKVLIVDFDVHHGNGTQKMFYENPDVLFFSVHRFDNGHFYPGGYDGSPLRVGMGAGTGTNINVGWNRPGAGDADYLAAWKYVLLPAATNFNPDLVIVSAGFDAADGDPLGGCHVTPWGYGTLLHKLMTFAKGKVIMALEGGYNLKALSQSNLICASVLMGNPPPQRLEPLPPPSRSCLKAIGNTIRAHSVMYHTVQESVRDNFKWVQHTSDPTPKKIVKPQVEPNRFSLLGDSKTWKVAPSNFR